MLNKLKQIKFTKKGVYISLAVCMLLIGCIGIYSSVRNMGRIIEETDFKYNEDISVPSTLDAGKEKIPEAEISKPVIKEEQIIELNFIQPVEGEISKTFSGEELVYSETMNDYRTHTGVDILSSYSEPVYSSEAGRIANIENHPLWGNCITVEHENDYTTCYRNLSDSLPEGIEVGSYVAKGGLLGVVGTTALVEIGEQPHLHFEMYVNGEPVDPIEHLN